MKSSEQVEASMGCRHSSQAKKSYDVVHSPGPLDGSLYAKVNKSKKGEHGDNLGHGDNHGHGDNDVFSWPQSPTQKPTEVTSPTDRKKLHLSTSSSPTSPSVVVLNGNKIVYVPQTAPPSVSLEQGSSKPNGSAFENPYLSISPTSKNFSSMTNMTSHFVTSTQVTRVELTEGFTKPRVVVRNLSDENAETDSRSEISADDEIQKTASQIVSDVIKNGEKAAVKGRDGPSKLRFEVVRMSGVSSCSATTLSSTETEDGEEHPELSDRNTSSESSSDSEKVEKNTSLVPNLEKRPAPSDLATNDLEVKLPADGVAATRPTGTLVKSSVGVTSKVIAIEEVQKGTGPDLPTPPPVPVQSVHGAKGTDLKDRGVMQNGGIKHGNYSKGPDYAVPMRDMKITTVPSKRAVLVSASAESDDGFEHGAMTSVQQDTANDRDSFYDEGNMSYGASGYATIDEFATDPQKGVTKDTESDIADLPDDVQALLNGLQDGPISSDIDSGFHGSAAALPHGHGERVKVTSQSSSDFSDPYPSPSSMPNSNNNATPSYEGKSYFTERVIPHNGSEAQHAQYTHSPVAVHNAQVPMVGREVYYPDQNAQRKATPKRPGVTTSTQTFPEPEEAKIEIITMRNVYETDPNKPIQPQQLVMTRKPVKPDPALSPVGPTTITSPGIPSSTPKDGSYIVSPSENPPSRGEAQVLPTEPFYDPVEEEMERENMKNVEEQIRHTQQHLMFLQDQQEKLLRRKIDRTIYRETKRNSSAFESHSQGYQFSLPVSSTLPRQPHRHSGERIGQAQDFPPTSKKREDMSPVATTHPNQMGGPTAVQQNQQDIWQPHGRKLTRQASDTSYDRQRPIGPTKTQPVEAEPEKTNNDSIMSNDLQEQLAELDRCIAQLTFMDVPEPQDGSSAPRATNQRRSFTLDIERKMNPNIPDSNKENSVVVPRPPTRSRSSFDSYKRLSQEFDGNIKRKSFNEQDSSVSDDVFSPGPQVPRKKKSQPFPPQTSVTRRQQLAPAPPPKRRLSLEERLSPQLIQALSSNPGAKPKEDIHSYKEDLEPEGNAPVTPAFPNSPTTPYVNSESPDRAKSPPGLMKTPLSILHLKPTDSPTEALHHHQNEVKSSPANGQAMQNGHVKETALLSDGGRRHDGLEARNSAQREDAQQKANGNGQNHRIEYSGPSRSNEFAVHTNIIKVQRDIKPVHSTPQQQQPPPVQTSQLHSRLPSEPPTTPQPPQYQHNHSGASHSSHSPAATSSNSRRESSDSLDGPSTRHSNSSLLSSSSSASSPHSGPPASSPNSTVQSPPGMMRPGSQLSSYDRNFHMSGTRSGDESLGSPQSGRTSSSSISDVDRMNSEMSQATVSKAPKFIRDTTSFWYKPDITRDQALALLRDKAAGCFVVRDSRCFPGAFGLALKVDKLPPTVQARPGVDVTNEYVRHFLIEPSSRGVKLKGCPNEPVFGTLSALVYQHSITPLALPCKLIIPTADLEITPVPGTLPRKASQSEVATNSASELLKQGAACNVIYIGSVDTESLTGPQAIERAIRDTYKVAQTNPSKTSIVHFKVSPQGITLTDNARKLFFRRHYPTVSVTYCGLDPLGNTTKVQKARRWDATGVHGGPDAWLFGFVARKQAGASDNTCHVFAELDPAQPARAIVNFVTKVLIGTSRQNYP